MTINLITSAFDAVAPEVAVASFPFKVGSPLFKRNDGRVRALAGSLSLTEAATQGNWVTSPTLATVQTITLPTTAGSTTSPVFTERMVEAGGMAFLVYRVGENEVRTRWARKDGAGALNPEVVLSNAGGAHMVSDVFSDGTNIAVVLLVNWQVRVFFFNATQWQSPSNGQVLAPVNLPSVSNSPYQLNHVFDEASGNLYYGIAVIGLAIGRVNIVTGATLAPVTVAATVDQLQFDAASRTRGFDMERFKSGQIALVYKAGGNLNFAVYDANLVAVGVPQVVLPAATGTLGSYMPRRIAALGNDRICWGGNSQSKAFVYVLTSAGVLTMPWSVAVTAPRSTVTARLANGGVAFAYHTDAGGMGMVLVNTDGTLLKMLSVAIGAYQAKVTDSQLIVPFADRFLLMVVGSSNMAYGFSLLNDGTSMASATYTLPNTNNAPGYGWSGFKLNSSGSAAVLSGSICYYDGDVNYTNYVLTFAVSSNTAQIYLWTQQASGTNQISISNSGGNQLLADGMQFLMFGQDSSPGSNRTLRRMLFEQHVFAGISGSSCANAGDLSYVFTKGAFRVNLANSSFNYNAATPVPGVKGNVSSGLMNLN